MPPPNEEYVLDLLRDVGLVTRKQIEEARANLNGSTSVVEFLVSQGVVSADDISRSLAAQAHMHWVDLADLVVPQDVIDEIKPQDARRFKMIPIARNEHGLVVATGVTPQKGLYSEYDKQNPAIFSMDFTDNLLQFCRVLVGGQMPSLSILEDVRRYNAGDVDSYLVFSCVFQQKSHFRRAAV